MMAGTAADFGPSQCGLSMSSTKDGPPHGAGKDRTAAELSLRGGSAGKGFASPKNRADACPGASEASARGCSPSGKRRSEEHTSELQSLMRNSYAVFCLKKKTKEQTKCPGK